MIQGQAVNKPLIVVGRAGIDLYADQEGTDLQSVSSFQRYVGGSAGNIAVQSARLSGSSLLFTRIADDPWGRYLREYLISCGVTPLAKPAPIGSRNSLAVAEIKPEESRVLFYRQDPADLHLSTEDIEEKTLSQSAGIIITGTSLSGSPSREAVLLLLYYAEQHSLPAILDLDYRPTGYKDEGEIFVYYQTIMGKCDILIGTDEEFRQVFSFLKKRRSLPFKDEVDLAKFLLRDRTRLVIIKKGKRGSIAYHKKGGQIRETVGGVFPVKVKKNFGSGDAFAGTFCYFYLKNRNLSLSLKRAAAAAAIVVSRGTCTEAMPREEEINDFIKHTAYRV